MKTFIETLQEAQSLKESRFDPTKINEPNIRMTVEVDIDHVNDAKKIDSFLNTLHKVTKTNSGTVKGVVYVTKENADEVLDMIERNTIKIEPTLNVSYDLHFDDGSEESTMYKKVRTSNTREIIRQFERLENNTVRKFD